MHRTGTCGTGPRELLPKLVLCVFASDTVVRLFDLSSVMSGRYCVVFLLRAKWPIPESEKFAVDGVVRLSSGLSSLSLHVDRVLDFLSVLRTRR